MCGLAGIIDCSGTLSEPELKGRVEEMTASLAHRGPDGDGVWTETGVRPVGLGHRRLAVIELSPAGAQPMVSQCSRHVLVYNGEVYNHARLRSELERVGHKFRGGSDTEVVLAALAEWGPQALARFTGMFALALWDREEKTLLLARDRMGEKPLYMGWAGNFFIFASELKAFRRLKEFEPEIDRISLARYMRRGYVPCPGSIYARAWKLPPGSFASIRADRLVPGAAPEPVRYWDLAEAAMRGLDSPFTGSGREAAERLEELLRDSVRGQLVADVPLGLFLSGGIDSSCLACLAQAESARPVKTFTVGFAEKEFDESDRARQTARVLGTEHVELRVSAGDALEVAPLMPRIYDEPFADSSQIPTYLISRLCREHVTVCLSGDGGDELLAGYNTYFWTRRILRLTGFGPAGRAFSLLGKVRPGLLNALARPFGRRNIGHKLHRLAELVKAGSAEEIFSAMTAHWPEAECALPGGIDSGRDDRPGLAARLRPEWTSAADAVTRLQLIDCLTYLPDDILVKADRASMAASLETRAPFLDHRAVEFCFSLDPGLKTDKGRGKLPLRRILAKHLPEDFFTRPKKGFSPPLAQWLRGPLRDWAESLLDENRLRQEGYLPAGPVRARWGEHLSGNRDWKFLLWDALMFQAWLEGEKEGRCAS